jgi:hypothetical protein
MKSFFETVARWLWGPRDRGEAPNEAKPVSAREHERRLRELAESGRTLFLP